MKHLILRWVTSIASCSVMLFASKMQAQFVPSTPPPVRSAPGASATANVEETQPAGVARGAGLPAMAPTIADSDHAIAVWIALGHREQVELGNLAREKTQTPKVKLLAIQTVDDHNRALTDLVAMYPNAVAPADTPRPALPRPIDDSTRPAGTVSGASAISPPRSVSNQPGQTGGPVVSNTPASVLELRRRAHDEYLSLVKRKLAEKQGADFDVAYVGMMLVKHQEMYATLQAFRDIASPDLRKLIEAQMQTVQIHYGRTDQLMPEVSSLAVTARASTPVPK